MQFMINHTAMWLLVCFCVEFACTPVVVWVILYICMILVYRSLCGTHRHRLISPDYSDFSLVFRDFVLVFYVTQQCYMNCKCVFFLSDDEIFCLFSKLLCCQFV